MNSPTLRSCAAPPPGLDTVLVAALKDDAVLLLPGSRLPSVTYRDFEPLDSAIKAELLLACGALIERTRIVGILEADSPVLVYAARIAALDRIAPPTGQPVALVPLDVAAPALHRQLGHAADALLNAALDLTRPK